MFSTELLALGKTFKTNCGRVCLILAPGSSQNMGMDKICLSTVGAEVQQSPIPPEDKGCLT